MLAATAAPRQLHTRSHARRRSRASGGDRPGTICRHRRRVATCGALVSRSALGGATLATLGHNFDGDCAGCGTAVY